MYVCVGVPLYVALAVYVRVCLSVSICGCVSISTVRTLLLLWKTFTSDHELSAAQHTMSLFYFTLVSIRANGRISLVCLFCAFFGFSTVSLTFIRSRCDAMINLNVIISTNFADLFSSSLFFLFPRFYFSMGLFSFINALWLMTFPLGRDRQWFPLDVFF